MDRPGGLSYGDWEPGARGIRRPGASLRWTGQEACPTATGNAMSYTGLAYRLPRVLRRHILHFETEIVDAVAAFAAALPAGARMLDAGSGEGQYRHHFGRQRYCGVDLAVGDATWDYSKVDALADLTALPFREGTFDAAIHIVTIEHLREPGARACRDRALAGSRRPAADRRAARVGSPPGAARLFPIYALRLGVPAGAGGLRGARDERRRRLFPTAGPAPAQRATILHRRHSLAACFVPAAILLVPPALILPLLDSLDRDRNFTLGYLCTARKRDLSVEAPQKEKHWTESS